MFPPKNILYPINLESKNILIINRIFIMAKKLDSKIHVLFVNDAQAGYRHPHKTEIDVKLSVATHTNPELLEGLDVTYHVRQGSLADEVQVYCDKHNIDLIVTGHKHHNKLYSALFDTADESIIDNVSVPVLVIPKNVAEEESGLVE